MPDNDWLSIWSRSSTHPLVLRQLQVRSNGSRQNGSNYAVCQRTGKASRSTVSLVRYGPMPYRRPCRRRSAEWRVAVSRPTEELWERLEPRSTNSGTEISCGSTGWWMAVVSAESPATHAGDA